MFSATRLQCSALCKIKSSCKGYHWKKTKNPSQKRCEIINSGLVVRDTMYDTYIKGKFFFTLSIEINLDGKCIKADKFNFFFSFWDQNRFL